MARRDVPALTPSASLDDAMRRFGVDEVDGVTLLPVVTGPARAGGVGVVPRESVLAAYYRQTVATIETRRQGDLGGPRVGRRGGRFREVQLAKRLARGGRRACGRSRLPAAARRGPGDRHARRRRNRRSRPHAAACRRPGPALRKGPPPAHRGRANPAERALWRRGGRPGAHSATWSRLPAYPRPSTRRTHPSGPCWPASGAARGRPSPPAAPRSGPATS